MNRMLLLSLLVFAGCTSRSNNKPQPDELSGKAASPVTPAEAPGVKDHPSAKLKLNVVRKYRLFESDQQRPLTADAITLANRVLGDDVSFRLQPSWKPGGIAGRESIAVYLVDVDPPGEYGPSFVPKGDRCIFVDAQRAGAISDVFSKKYEGAIKLQDDQLLAITLLHEAGHIFHKHWGGMNGGEVTTDRKFGVEETDEKKREFDADRFAAAQIKSGMAVGGDLMRFTASMKLAVTLTTVSANLTFQRLMDNFGATTLELPSAFWDAGWSHPNFEYRFLRINYEINPSKENQQLLDGFEKARKRAVEKQPLFKKN
jgi:hypothetical protein